MNIHFLQHAESEGSGQIGLWSEARGHKLTSTHWYRGDTAPDPSSIDFLVIMGGAMNVYEYRDYPWLPREKALIQAAIARGIPVLGVCLGAQLIADVMGGKVYQNPVIELGWFPVRMAAAARETPGFAHFPEEITPLHWHGDTFDLPPGATLLASSEACPNQAFVRGQKIVGLQFHIEVTPEDVRAFIDGEPNGLPSGPRVQSADEIMAGDKFIPGVHRALEGLLDYMAPAKAPSACGQWSYRSP